MDTYFFHYRNYTVGAAYQNATLSWHEVLKFQSRPLIQGIFVLTHHLIVEVLLQLLWRL